METECLHAQPEPGEAASPCCGRTLDQLPRYDRIVLDPAKVTCGRLTPEQEFLLSGQPAVTDPDHEQIVFAMASTVANLSGASLRASYDQVNMAIRAVLPHDRVVDRWTAELMVAVSSHAQARV